MIRGAVAPEGMDRGSFIVNEIPPAPDEIAVVVLREEEYAALTAERNELRRRLFNTRKVEGTDHSTACSIWGEDGQGNAEGIEGPLPCNCGALINFYTAEAERHMQGRNRYWEARDLLAEDLDKCRKAHGLMINTLDRVMDQRNRYREALERYGVHSVYCSCGTPSGVGAGPCDCGFRDALNREKGAEG